MKKRYLFIFITIIILIILLSLKFYSSKTMSGDDQKSIKKTLCSILEVSEPEGLKIIDSIVEDDKKFVGYSYNNGIGLVIFRKEKDKFKFQYSESIQNRSISSFSRYCGGKDSIFKYIVVLNDVNKDISKIKFIINEKEIEKHVTSDESSMIIFTISLHELDKSSFTYTHELYDSNNQIIQLN